MEKVKLSNQTIIDITMQEGQDFDGGYQIFSIAIALRADSSWFVFPDPAPGERSIFQFANRL
jgi:hypothetical protein